MVLGDFEVVFGGFGVVFGPKPHPYKKSTNRKMRQLARKSVLSSKASDGAIFVVDEFKFNNPKTSQFNQLVKDLKLTGKRITVLPAIVDENLFLSVRNLRNITLLKVDHASTYDLIDNDILLFDKAGIMLLNEQLKN